MSKILYQQEIMINENTAKILEFQKDVDRLKPLNNHPEKNIYEAV